MPEYTSAYDLLLDAELRADGLGSSKGVLIVEGPDDKRVFARHVADPAQILPAGGRRLLMSAHEKASEIQRTKMIFVTDCDYEVRFKTLHGASDLVITTYTDMESDLISLGLIEAVLIEFVPSALSSNSACRSIAATVSEKARNIALPMGRMRMAAKPLGIPINLDDVKISRYWDARKGEMNSARLVDAMHTKVSEAVTFEQWRDRVDATPTDFGMCHGKDLVRAVAFLLKTEHRSDGITVDSLARVMRSSISPAHLKSWDVVRRIESWQQANRRDVFLS
ncbi:hypothetical protein [Streptomyces gardneri]|uniref:hypothetical protein n=1 Tax=Streptomyces gardneri TaxID=66892 RepID=UPI003403B778